MVRVQLGAHLSVGLDHPLAMTWVDLVPTVRAEFQPRDYKLVR